MSEFKTGGYCPTCLHASDNCTCMQTLSDLIKKNVMDETIYLPASEMLDMKNDLEYFIAKRDDALDHFNWKLKSHLRTDEELHRSLDIVLKLNKHVKLVQDAIVAYNVIRASNTDK